MGYLRNFVFQISLLSTTAEMRKDDNQFRRHLQVRLGGGLQCQARCTDDGIGGSNGAAFFNRPAELIHSTQYRLETRREMLTYYSCTLRFLYKDVLMPRSPWMGESGERRDSPCLASNVSRSADRCAPTIEGERRDYWLWRSSQTLSGVAGMSMCSMPHTDSASSNALM